MSVTEERHGRLDTGYTYTLRPELHKALMARGIDYWVAQGITFWNRDDGCECLAYGYKADGVPKLAIKVVGFTDPEQVVEATLGREECRVEYTHRYDYEGGYGGTEYEHGLTCGHKVTWGSDDAPDFCQHCGAKVVQR